jgi:hypothetical protein
LSKETLRDKLEIKELRMRKIVYQKVVELKEKFKINEHTIINYISKT